MTDCADIYSFTKEGSRKDDFLNSFRSLTNGVYARKSGVDYTNRIYRTQIVNIVSDPKAMDLRVPESMSDITRVGITKKKRALALQKRLDKERAKIIAVDGEKEVLEDGKIKMSRKKQKFLPEPEPRPSFLDLNPWEKIIPDPYHATYTLAQELHDYEAKFKLEHRFPTTNDFKNFLDEFADMGFTSGTPESIQKFNKLVSVISGVYKTKVVNYENDGSIIPTPLTAYEVNKIAEQVVEQSDFDLLGNTGYPGASGSGLTGQLIEGMLPMRDEPAVVERARIIGAAKLSGGNVDDILTVDENLNLTVKQKHLDELNQRIASSEARAAELQKQYEQNMKKFRALAYEISSSDDDYRDRAGIVYEQQRFPTTQETLRAVSRETQGGSVGGGPVFKQVEPLSAPRRPASYPRSVGPGGIAGEDYVP